MSDLVPHGFDTYASLARAAYKYNDIGPAMSVCFDIVNESHYKTVHGEREIEAQERAGNRVVCFYLTAIIEGQCAEFRGDDVYLGTRKLGRNLTQAELDQAYENQIDGLRDQVRTWQVVNAQPDDYLDVVNEFTDPDEIVEGSEIGDTRIRLHLVHWRGYVFCTLTGDGPPPFVHVRLDKISDRDHPAAVIAHHARSLGFNVEMSLLDPILDNLAADGT